MKSIKPRKQRKYLHNAPLHKKRKWISSHMAENLLLKYDKRSIPIITGDTVTVMRGSFKGHEDKVASIHVKKQVVEVEGMTMVKADGTKIAKPVHASNLLITKLNLTDRWRRKKLERGLSETTKKEIEQEAAQQLKEIEQEQLAKEKLEEEQEISEEDAAKEESTDKTEQTEPEVKKQEKPAEKKPAPQKKTEEKKQTKTETQSKPEKSTEKKSATTKKKTTSKTPSKSKESKEEGKK